MATLLTVYGSLVVVGLPIIRAGLPVEQVGRFVADQSAEGAEVGVLGLDRWESGLAYYLGNAPKHLESAKDAERFATEPGTRWVVARREALTVGPGGGCVAFSLPAIVGTTGRGVRTQVWGDVVVIRYGTKTSYVDRTCPAP